MAAPTHNTIELEGRGPRSELVANAAITPGQLCEVMSTGKVRKHATAGGFHERLIAQEDSLQGNGITDNYAAAAKVQLVSAEPGQAMYMLLKDGENATTDEFLESAGDGDLRVYIAGTRVGRAMDAVDLSDSSGADPATRRIRVRIV